MLILLENNNFNMIIINELLCNAKCDYCYVYKVKYDFVIEKMIDNIITIINKEKEIFWKSIIRFFWSEPLLNHKWIIKTLELLKERNIIIDELYINTNLIFDNIFFNSFINELLSYEKILYIKLNVITTYMWLNHNLIRGINKEKEVLIKNNIKTIIEKKINIINNYVITSFDTLDNFEKNIKKINKLFNYWLKFFNFLPLSYVYWLKSKLNDKMDEKVYENILYKIKELYKKKKIPLPQDDDYFSNLESSNIPLYSYDLIVMPNWFLTYSLANIEEWMFQTFNEINLLNHKKELIEDYLLKTFFDNNYRRNLGEKIKEKIIWFFGKKNYNQTLSYYKQINNILFN